MGLGPRIYSSLPHDIKESENMDTFKRKIKSWLHNLPRHFVQNLVNIKNA